MSCAVLTFVTTSAGTSVIRSSEFLNSSFCILEKLQMRARSTKPCKWLTGCDGQADWQKPTAQLNPAYLWVILYL